MCFQLDKEETILLWFKVMAAASCLSLVLEPDECSCILLSVTLDLQLRKRVLNQSGGNDAFILLMLRPWSFLQYVEQSPKFSLTEGYFW